MHITLDVHITLLSELIISIISFKCIIINKTSIDRKFNKNCVSKLYFRKQIEIYEIIKFPKIISNVSNSPYNQKNYLVKFISKLKLC